MKALITGVTGQDGGFLASHLNSLGYDVYGLIRRSSTSDAVDRLNSRTDGKVKLVLGDVTDYSSIASAINNIKPDEVYNLAAQSHVGISFYNPVYTSTVNGNGVLNVIEAIRNNYPKAKLYQASTS